MTRYRAASAGFLMLIAFAAASPARSLPEEEGEAMAAARPLSPSREALREPSSADYLNAIQIYPYAKGVLYRLYTAPGRVTDIALQPGETVTSVAAGDTARWTVGDTTSGSGDTRRTHILVKPFSAGLRTNLIITTDRRVYHLQLQSTEAAYMAAISWRYPEDELVALRRAEAAAPVAAVALEHLDFGYEISGDEPAWRPLRVFDDGRQTFIQFPASLPTGEAPPLFLVGVDGEPQLVNYRLRGRYYVVDRLFDRAELRLGKRRQQVVRIERAGANARRRERDL